MNLVKINSINIWDEEWESGSYNTDGTPLVDAARIRTKNYITVEPSTSYYFKTAGKTFGIRWYDANHSWINNNVTVRDGAVTSPSNAKYLRFSIVDCRSYNNDIQVCLNSESQKTIYHPHWVLGLDGQGKAIATEHNLFKGEWSQFDCQGGTGTVYAYFKLPDNKNYMISVTSKDNLSHSGGVVLGLTGNGGNASAGFQWAVASSEQGVVGAGKAVSTTQGYRFVTIYPKEATSLEYILEHYNVLLVEI